MELKFKSPTKAYDVRWCVEAYSFSLPIDNKEYSGHDFAEHIRKNFDCSDIRNFAAARIAEDGIRDIKRKVGDVIIWRLTKK